MGDKVSIIIVNWNGRKWLKKCLDSLFSQTYKNFEIIFVDNNSTDDSIDFVRSSYDLSKLRIVESDRNLGFAGGNNLGIKNATGKYIMFFNNDAWVKDDFLEKTVYFYIENNFDIIGPTETDYEDKTLNDRVVTIDFFGHPIYLDKDGKSKEFYLPGVCLFFKKDLYEETRGLDERFFMYFEEVDWFWRLNLLKKRFSFMEDVFIHHAGAGSTGGGIKYHAFLWRNQNCLQMLLKNYSWINLAWVLPVYFLQNVFEILFFLLLLRPKIAGTYFMGWWFNMKHLKETLKKRQWIQKNRKVSDFQLMRERFYFGFAKLYHLRRFKK
jgi:GT2 family glycosyltransferase